MRSFKFLLAAAMLLALSALAVPSQAGGGEVACGADPTSGPPGTVFVISCNGFAANSYVNAYLVEPDGRAMDGNEANPFGTSDVNGNRTNTFKVNGKGAVTFYFTTSSFNGSATAMIGKWAVVVNVPGSLRREVDVNVTSSPFNASGGALSYATQDGRSFVFAGAGFATNEVVNVWLTLPSNCSGTSGSAVTDSPDSDRTAIGAVNPFNFNTSLGWDYPGYDTNNPDFSSNNQAVQTDSKGAFWMAMHFRDYACTGWYAFTARALGSGTGAIIEFEVKGNAVTATGASLVAQTGLGTSALNPVVTLSGAGFPAGSRVNCWLTRPDGRALTFGARSILVGADGSFSVTGYAEDVDATESGSDLFSESAEPGWWLATCATPNRSVLATASFALYALLTP